MSFLCKNQYFFINKIPDGHIYMVTSQPYKLKEKEFNLLMIIGKGSSLLSIISLKIVSSLIKAIFQNNAFLFQRSLKKKFQRSIHCSNR